MGTPDSQEQYKIGLDLFGKKQFKDAFHAWLDAAEWGYPKAMCDVGWMFSQGNGVAKDDKKAFEWMLKAAEKGYVRAQNNIGLYYKNGTGTPVNIQKAVHWLERAEEAKYEKLAENTLKNCRALLAMRNEERVTPEQEHQLGMSAFTNKDYKTAFERWQSAASRGSAEAMCDVGWMFSQGYGVPKDDRKAFEWMLKAAKRGYVRAQNNIGLYYKNGTGTPADVGKAVEWLEKAEIANYPKLAKKTLKDARSLLAQQRTQMEDTTVTPQHEYSVGLELFGKKKHKEAFDLWLSAARRDYAKAMCDVGWMYSQGHGVAKDNQKAFEWMLKAADLGYVRAQNNIGLYYKNGTGTPVNLKAAVSWLEKAEAAKYEKLARKALKEARRLLSQQKSKKQMHMQPVSYVGVGGPEIEVDKYKSALKVALAGKHISADSLRVLSDQRRENQISDQMHTQCLQDLGYTEEEYRIMTEAPQSAEGPGGKNECVVCLDAVADHCILFCMHVCLCKNCAKNYVPGGEKTCPKCRGKVEMVKKIF